MNLAKIWRGICYRYRRAIAPGFVTIGQGAKIDVCVSFCQDLGKISVGSGTTIVRGSTLLSPVTIGENCFINGHAFIRPGTTIGSRVSIGAFARLVTGTHEVANTGQRCGPLVYKPIVVEDGVWIGVGVTVLGGVTLGRGCVVAAGSLVAHDVPANTLVMGYPARHIRTLDPLTDD